VWKIVHFVHPDLQARRSHLKEEFNVTKTKDREVLGWKVYYFFHDRICLASPGADGSRKIAWAYSICNVIHE
jgi:hypothetical protein